MVLEYLTPKITKSHFVKKSEIFCCVLIFEIHFQKRKTCENAVFTQVLELLVGLEPTACALRMRCSTNWATVAFVQFFTCFEPKSANNLPFTNQLLYQLSHSSKCYSKQKQPWFSCSHIINEPRCFCKSKKQKSSVFDKHIILDCEIAVYVIIYYKLAGCL